MFSVSRLEVSIHAPAGGATLTTSRSRRHTLSFNPRSRGGSDLGSFSTRLTILRFNPRSRGGSDAYRSNPSLRMPGFNPRSRGGSDPFADRCRCRAGSVSIHAPAGGATRYGKRRFGPWPRFNPRSRGGSDIRSVSSRNLRDGFNPRSRGGSDRNRLGQRFTLPLVSIHAPAGGATSPCDFHVAKIKFQSTLPRGERPRR